MFTCLVLLIATVLPRNETVVLEDHVDVIELNHVYNEGGDHTLDQWIFYVFNKKESRFDIIAWRLHKDPGVYIVKDHSRKRYWLIFRDGEILRKVTSSSYRETWTQYDPELEARNILSTQQRRELTKPSATKIPAQSEDNHSEEDDE